MANIFSRILWIISRCLYLVTVQLPSGLFSLLSWGGVITLEFNFVKLALLVLGLATATNYYIKYKYLNKYSKLPPVSQKEARQKSNLDLNPDVQTDARNGLHNYLDEFLSAIRIFGYLERPVFHELARHLQTRRLSAGETLSLTDDKSFYIVIDGKVQVFVQPETRLREPRRNSSAAYHDEDDNGFRLINEVGSGATLSSLFTILNLFTEDVKLRYEPSQTSSGGTGQDQQAEGAEHLRRSRASSLGRSHLDPLDHITELDLDSPRSPTSEQPKTPGVDQRDAFRPTRLREAASFDSSSDTQEPTPTAETVSRPCDETNGARPQSPRPPLKPSRSTYGPQSFRSDPDLDGRNGSGEQGQEHVIARAVDDTTLAVLPAEAFRKLTKRYPNAAAHIVQVILTRLQRVTFLTAHKYLGLTKEVVRTEKAINELACYPLPSVFYEQGGMHRLRQRFQPETKIVDSTDEDDDYFAFDPPPGSTPHNAIRLRHKGAPTPKRTPTRAAGDLLSMATLDDEPVDPTYARHLHESPTRTPLATPRVLSGRSFSLSKHEDFDLRTEVMQSISRSIGLASQPLSASPSVEASPTLSAFDVDRGSNLGQRAAFNSSFGSLSFLDAQSKDEESVTMSASSHNAPSAPLADLENEVQILYYAKGSTLVRAGERNAGLFYVIDGFLDVYMPTDEMATAPLAHTEATPRTTSSLGSQASRTKQPEDRFLFSVKAGGIAGYLSSLSGFPSYVDIRAKTEVYVGFLPAKALERIMDRRPIVLLTLAKRLTGLISPLVLHIDSALDWMHVNAGQVIYRQNDPSDCFYIVIQGRLRSIVEREGGGVDIRGEFGQGESVGELDSITDTPRPTTLHAIRDSELARMPMTLFNAIAVRHPGTTIHMTRLIASRVRDQLATKQRLGGPPLITDTAATSNNYNLKTVAILPVSHAVPVSEFAARLRRALEDMGAPTSYLNQATIMTVLGRHAFSRMGKLKLAGWLGENEQRFRIVLYVADTSVTSPWTQTCIRQADCIYLVAEGDHDPSIGEYERLLIGMKTTARKELILLHPERYVPSGQTRPWLLNRPWIQAHHHVELGRLPALRHKGVSYFGDVQRRPGIVLKRIREKLPPVFRGDTTPTRTLQSRADGSATSDFARLARRLCGKSIGVVLGGGGARGISHVGALRALQEQGIPVDMIGGTSIGAFIGGLYARDADLVSTLGRAKRFSGRMSTLWRLLTDVTWPIVAYTTGHEFNRGIFKSFLDYQIEDFWLSFFAVTTNITWSRMEVHTRGYAWRYIRASMSLAGMLPPLCDQGDMLVDGGYFDNLPVSVMLEQGASSVFAIDVGSVDDTSPRNFGESVSGWFILLNRYNPWSNARQVPTITEIQSRLTYVSSVKTLEDAKATPGVLYMRMPVTDYGTMDFGKFDVIMKVGFDHARKSLGQWARDDALPTGREGDLPGEEELDYQKRRGNRIRRASI